MPCVSHQKYYIIPVIVTLFCHKSSILNFLSLLFVIYMKELFAPGADRNSLSERAQNLKTLAVLVLKRAIKVLKGEQYIASG